MAWAVNAVQYLPASESILNEIIQQLKAELRRYPNCSGGAQALANLIDGKDNLCQQLTAARNYVALGEEYKEAVRNLGSLLRQHADIEDIVDAYWRIQQLYHILNKRRRGHQGPLSDFRKWCLIHEYNFICGPFPQRKILEKYDIPIPPEEKQATIGKTSVCQKLADAYDIEYEQCANILHTNKDRLLAPPPSKVRPIEKKHEHSK